MKRLLFIISLVLLTTGFGSGVSRATANTPQIDPAYNNRIIDDSIFLNSGTMSVNDIQNFLNSKVPVCDTGHQGGLAQYPPPYVCLKDYVDPTTGKRAAQLIYDEAISRGLNPQVILTTLEKEQSLITDTWPYPSQYKTAMGYGCPEGAACDADYFGLYNQIHLGSGLLRAGAARNCGDNTTLSGYYISPQWRLGGSPSVDGVATRLDSCATGSLYNYTPHRPDTAYIARPSTCPSAGGYCYGNYNFVTLFQNYFGPTWVPSYSWAYAGQTASKNLGNLAAGEKAVLTVSARNTGSTTWTNDGPFPTNLGASHPNDRSSAFSTSSWLGSSRPARLNEASVSPGQIGTFAFTIQAPNAPGDYNEYFNLVTENIRWFNDPGLYFGIHVVPASLVATPTADTLPVTLQTDTSASGAITVRNDGNVTWYNDGKFPIDLGTSNPLDRQSQFANTDWLGANRPAHMTEASVAPGQTGTFSYSLKAPHIPGNYTESFSLVAENMSWSPAVINHAIAVRGTYVAASAETPSLNIVAGASASVTVHFTNNGTSPWSNSGATPVKLGTDNPRDRTSGFCDASWLACNRAALLTESTVAPGATGTFTFTVKTSVSHHGQYKEYFTPVAEGQEWFGTPVPITINVAPPTYTWSLAGQAAYTDNTKSTSVDLTKLSPGQTAWLQLKATNTGNVTWTNSGANPIDLGTEAGKDRRSALATSAWLGFARPARLLEASVAPGSVGTFEFPILAPATGGVYNERFNLVAEGITWMNDIGLSYYSVVNSGFSWSLATQYAYTTSAKTTAVDLTQLTPGQTVFIGLTARNTGTATWFNTGPYPLDLASTHPIDRSSAFANGTWLSPARPVRLKEASVAPGQNGTFEFTYTAPSTAGGYHEYFNPVAEGITHLNDIGLNFYTIVH